MGASESTLASLQEKVDLLPTLASVPDEAFWETFYLGSYSRADLSNVLAAHSVRQVRQTCPAILTALISALISRLVFLRHSQAFPSAALPTSQALSCMSILVRVLPLVFEDEKQAERLNVFLWDEPFQAVESGEAATSVSKLPEQVKRRLKGRPAGELLLDTLVDLLFFNGFTVASPESKQHSVSYSVWQAGIGRRNPTQGPLEHERNRVDIIRLLLVLTGQALYTPAESLGSPERATVYLASRIPEHIVQCLLCSLANTAFHPRSWKDMAERAIQKADTQALPTYSLLLLLLLVLCPIPELETGSKNLFRYFLGQVHQSADFEFLYQGIRSALERDIKSIVPISFMNQEKSVWPPATLVLFWELLQCNPHFSAFLDPSRCREMVAVLLSLLRGSLKSPSEYDVARLCVYSLQTISLLPGLLDTLNEPVWEEHIRMLAFHGGSPQGTYADVLLSVTISFLESRNPKLMLFKWSLLDTFYNIAPFIKGLSQKTSRKLVHTMLILATPSYLFAQKGSEILLTKLYEAISLTLEMNYAVVENLYIVAGLHQNQDRFRALQLVSVECQLDRYLGLDLAPVDTAPVGGPEAATRDNSSPTASSSSDAHKGKGKLPAGDGIVPGDRKDREPSSAGSFPDWVTESWLRNWLPHLPLHTILTVVDSLPAAPEGSAPSIWSDAVQLCQSSLSPSFIPPSHTAKSVKWTPEILRWYEAFVWTRIALFEQAVSKGPLNPWAGTDIRLFLVQRPASGAPTLQTDLVGAAGSVFNWVVGHSTAQNADRQL